jgi:hypothetical protein
MAQTLGVGRAVVHWALEATKPEVSCLGATGLILKPKLNLIGKGRNFADLLEWSLKLQQNLSALQSAPFAARDTPPDCARVLKAPEQAGQVPVCRFPHHF